MSLEIDIRKVLDNAGGYAPEAARFIRDGLEHTVRTVHGSDIPGELAAPDDESRHVSGQELCLGLREFAIEQYGLLAKTVLNRWGVRRTEDFGRVVFALVDAGLMRKTDEDRLEDFQGVFDFDEEFAEPAGDAIA